MQKLMKIALLSMALAVVAAGCGAVQPLTGQAENKQTPVQVVPVETGSLYLQSDIIGTTQPSAESSVTPKMGGELVELYVEKNKTVKKGAVLGRIDSVDLNLQLELAQLNLEQAQLQYKNMNMTNADDVQLEQARSNVEQARIRVKQAEMALDNADIIAPISGTVVEVNGKVGEMAAAGNPLFKIVNLHPIQIKASIGATDMLKLQKKKEMNLSLPDIGKTLTAQITHISPVAQNGFYTAEFEANNADGAIKSGMTAILSMEEALVSDALLVPTRSIVDRGSESFIFVVREGVAIEVPVEVVESQSAKSAVKGDVSEGEQVVVKGQLTLSAGDQVKVIKEAQ